MFYFIKKILFHFKSQTSHGLHSPLVFDLYNQVLNPVLNNNIDLNKLIQGLEKYFDVHSIYFYPEIEFALQRLLLIVEEENILLFKNELFKKTEKFQNCIIIIQQPHKNMEDSWNEIKAFPKVTFTIDLFEFSILIFETIAPKQDFKLRNSS